MPAAATGIRTAKVASNSPSGGRILPLIYETLLKQKRPRGQGKIPHRSKLILKPTLQLEHEGEKRFDVGSAEHKILLDWIRAGAPGAGERRAESGVDPRFHHRWRCWNAGAVPPPCRFKVEAKFLRRQKRGTSPQWAVYETSSLTCPRCRKVRPVDLRPAGRDGCVRALPRRARLHARRDDRSPDGDFRNVWMLAPPANAIDEHVLRQAKTVPAEPRRKLR